MLPNRHKKAGFTLIEIAAALMVFGLLSVTILVVQGHMAHRARVFLETFQDLAEAKRARLKLERDQQLTKKERIEIPGVTHVSYQFATISEKSSLHNFSKMVGIGMIDIKHPTSRVGGFTDHFFSIVPLPIELKSPAKTAKDTKPLESQKPEKPGVSKLTVGRQTAGKKNG